MRRVKALLVGGEHFGHAVLADGSSSGMTGTSCSLPWIGRAYAQLRRFLPRDDIIVIAPLNDVKSWLETASTTGEPYFAKGMPSQESALRWRQKLETNVLRDCAQLLEEGGVDYDSHEVNPATILSVLEGKQIRGSEGRKVIPSDTEEPVTVLLGLYSHGNARASICEEGENDLEGMKAQKNLEARVPCFGCGQPHSKEKDAFHDHSHFSFESRDWYFHCPYEAPLEDQPRVLDGCITRGLKHPSSRLYLKPFYSTLKSIHAAHPNRQHVLVNHFCFSGGFNLPLIHDPSLASLPIYSVAASGPMQTSIPGLLPLFFETLANTICSPAAQESTLMDVFASVKAQYYARHPSLNPDVANQRYLPIKNACVVCKDFAGSEENDQMCSQCHKKHKVEGHPLPEQQKKMMQDDEDMSEDDEGLGGPEASSSSSRGGVSKKQDRGERSSPHGGLKIDPGFAVLESACSPESHLDKAPLRSLFTALPE